MESIYKQKKSFDFCLESQDPYLTTFLKCVFRKILSYCTPKALEKPLFFKFDVRAFCSF